MSITNNFLDSGFQNMLLPFQCMQNMFFLPSFSIECNCIRTPTVNYYIVSLIGTLGLILFHILTYFLTAGFEIFSPIVKFCNKVNYITTMIVYIGFYFINIRNGKINIQMILKIQSAFRVIYYKHYKMFIIGNWISVSLYFVFYFIIVLIARDLWGSFFYYSFLCFNVNIIYGIRMIALIRDGLKTWIYEVNYYGNLCSELEEQKYNVILEKLLQAYMDLMEAFDILKDILKISVSDSLNSNLIMV